MRHNIKMIQVPDCLISNQLGNGINVSPKTTYLYVYLKILLKDYESNILNIQPSVLKENIKWKTNDMLKNHLKILKELGLITYQSEFNDGLLKPNQSLSIYISPIKTHFKELSEKSIKEKIIPATDKPEKTVRLCYLIKCYTNKKYGYCWLTYRQIQAWGNIRQFELNELSKCLQGKKLLYITKGELIKDKSGQIRKENNKYQLLIN